MVAFIKWNSLKLLKISWITRLVLGYFCFYVKAPDVIFKEKINNLYSLFINENNNEDTYSIDYVDNSYSKCVSVERINYTPFLLYEKE